MKKTIALAVAVFALASQTSSAFAAPPAPVECWELMQTSLLAGKFRVIVTPKAFRIESLGNRYIVVSKAPDWQVYAYNPLSKTVFQSNVKDFKGNLASGTGALGGYLENLPILSAAQKPTKYLGQGSLKMHVENPKPTAIETGARKKNFNSVFFNTGEILSADYWTWTNPVVPATLPVVLNKMYKLPPGKTLPLKLLTMNTENETHLELDTSAIKRVPYDPKIFIVPANLTAVKEDLEVANDRRRQKAVKNLIQNWDEWGKIVDTGK